MIGVVGMSVSGPITSRETRVVATLSGQETLMPTTPSSKRSPWPRPRACSRTPPAPRPHGHPAALRRRAETSARSSPATASTSSATRIPRTPTEPTSPRGIASIASALPVRPYLAMGALGGEVFSSHAAGICADGAFVVRNQPAVAERRSKQRLPAACVHVEPVQRGV